MSRNGTSVYPATLDSFARVGTANFEDEVGYEIVHVENEAMDALEHIEAVCGTTLGTNVFKNVLAGQFVDTTVGTATLTNKTYNGTIGTLSNGTISSSNLSSPSFSGNWSGWVSAGETWTCTGADGNTGTVTIPSDVTGKYGEGMKVYLTQGTAKYGFVSGTPSVASGTTTMTLWGGTAYTFSAGTIGSPQYSTQKSPFGFVVDKSYWSVVTTDNQALTQGTPTQNTWYNLGTTTIVVPVGRWNLSFQCIQQAVVGSAAVCSVASCLSTANNSASDPQLTGFTQNNNTTNVSANVCKEKDLYLASKTTYYLNCRTVAATITDIYHRGDIGLTVINAVSSYI